jgi:hypothetical protein
MPLNCHNSTWHEHTLAAAVDYMETLRKMTEGDRRADSAGAASKDKNG